MFPLTLPTARTGKPLGSFFDESIEAGGKAIEVIGDGVQSTNRHRCTRTLWPSLVAICTKKQVSHKQCRIVLGISHSMKIDNNEWICCYIFEVTHHRFVALFSKYPISRQGP